MPTVLVAGQGGPKHPVLHEKDILPPVNYIRYAL